MRRAIITLISTALLVAAMAPAASGVMAAKPKCGGRVATIVGTDKAETIRGTNKVDVIVAKGGAGIIYGRGGKDVICGGGGGGDTIRGGGGGDTINGNNGGATLLPDGRFLVVGGQHDEFAALASAELWDPTTGSFSPAGSLAEPRFWHTATLSPDGRVIAIGGADPDSDRFASAEVWEPGELGPASEATDVISTDPVTGTEVPVDSTVSYSVSLGAEQVDQVAVPAIDGLGTIAASLALRDAGLRAASAVASSDSVPAGTVFDQSPAAGTLVDVGSTVSYSVSLGLGISQVLPPIADYWTDWADHKPLYRERARVQIGSARAATSRDKTRVYQNLVGIHSDELKWLKNHRPQACYAAEYEMWRKAVADLHSIHKKTVRLLRAGNASGVRRAAKEQRRDVRRLDKALSSVADCGPSEPAVADAAPAGNPFVGVWEARISSAAEKNGPYRTIRERVTINKSGRFLLRNNRDLHCRSLGHGFVPLTVQGSGAFDLNESPRFHSSGKLYCYPRGRARVLVHPNLSVSPYRYHVAADVMTREDGICYWRKGTGGPSDCRDFWRGVPAPVEEGDA